MATTRANSTAKMAQPMACQFSNKVRRSVVIPISKKMNEFATKAAYSQKLNTTMRVVGDMPRGPTFPLTMPAATTASTPLTWNDSASRYAPKASTVVSVVSTR